MSENILRWLAGRNVGASSKFMAVCALGLPYEDDFERTPHPHDPDDLNRCLKLLKVAPEVRQSFENIAKRSPVWAALIARWDEIEASFIEEAGFDWSKTRSAEKTYQLMRGIINTAEKSTEE